jgi:WD40 repeat protein
MSPLLLTFALLQPAPRLDAHGDPLPPGARCRIGTTRLRPGAPVTSLAFTPDGKRLVSATAWNGTYVWDAATGKELRHLRYPRDRVAAATLSADGSLVATNEGLSVTVRKVATGDEVCTVTVQAWTAFILTEFAPDGKSLAVLLHTGDVAFYDVPSGKLRHKHTIAAFDSPPFLEFAPDSKSVVVRWKTGTAARYDVATGKRLGEYRHGDETDEYYTVAFSADGKRLAGLTLEGQRIDVWDAATGEVTATLKPRRAPWRRLDFTPDGRHLLVCDLAGSADLWNPAQGKVVRTFVAGGPLSYTVFSPDGTLLATGSDTSIRLWRVADGKEVPAFDLPAGPPRGARFAPDGKTVLGDFGGGYYWWDAATGKLVRRLPWSGKDGAAQSVTADGSEVAVALGPSFEVRDAATGKVRFGKQRADHTAAQLRLSPDGKLLAVVWRAGDPVPAQDVLQLWETAADRLVLELTGRGGELWAVGFTRDGQGLRVNTAGEEQHVFHTYDSATGRKLPRASAAFHTSSLAAQAPDGRLLATSPTQIGTAIREVLTGNLVGIPTPQAALEALLFSPDGRLLALGSEDGAVVLWDVIRGQTLTTFRGHRSSARSLAFSPDGQRLLSGDPSGTVLVWDLAPWQTKARQADVKLTDKELDTLWEALASTDDTAGWPALATLVRAPEQAVTLFKAKLGPSTAAELAAIRGLIADLGSDKFAVRQGASAKLEKKADLAAPLLEKALAAKPTLEVRQRVEKLLQKLETPPPSPECLRQLRVLQALEMIGTPEALALLQALADGDPDAWLTREARAAGSRQ